VQAGGRIPAARAGASRFLSRSLTAVSWKTTPERGGAVGAVRGQGLATVRDHLSCSRCDGFRPPPGLWAAGCLPWLGRPPRLHRHGFPSDASK